MKPIDYDYWFSLDLWTFEQAAYLLSNIDPEDKEHITDINNVNYKRLNSGRFNSIDTFNKNLQLIKGTNFSKHDKDNALVGSVSLVDFFIFAKEKNLGRFPSRLMREWENSPMNPNKPITVPTSTAATKATKASTEGYFGEETINAFDSLPISGIAEWFLNACSKYDKEKWKNLAGKAKNNGLVNARTSVSRGSAESLFNPVQVANWLIARGEIKPEHARRILKNNLPDRSNNLLEDLFGYE